MHDSRASQQQLVSIERQSINEQLSIPEDLAMPDAPIGHLGHVYLAPMQQLAEAVNPEDDWTGLTNAKARRKRQNRLNKRAWRRRQLASTQSGSPANSNSSSSKFGAEHPYQAANSHSQTHIATFLRCAATKTKADGVPWDTFHSLSTSDAGSICASLPTNNGNAYFPLSTDHLLTLIQYNVFRAVLTNISLLALLSTFESCAYAVKVSIPLLPSTIPPSLHPTALQRTTPHSTWIDFFPLAAMRDNLIRAEVKGAYDADDLCGDMLGGLFGASGTVDYKGMIAWNDPWDVMGWEVSEGFVRKWGWLMKGCKELAEASNRWRELRNEDPLVIEV